MLGLVSYLRCCKCALEIEWANKYTRIEEWDKWKKIFVGYFPFPYFILYRFHKTTVGTLTGLVRCQTTHHQQASLKEWNFKKQKLPPPLSSSWSDPICLHKVRKIIEKSLYLAGHTVPPPSYQKTIPTPIWDVGAHILWKQSIRYEIVFWLVIC